MKKYKDIFQNMIWLITDKFLILILEFIVGVKIANYYKGEIYGEYTYAIAITAFFPILLEIMNRRVIKEYYDENFEKIVSVVTSFRNILSIIILIIISILFPLFKEERTLYVILLLLSVDSLLHSTTIGIENYFEFKLLSKNTVIANNIVKIISYFIQYVGILFNFSIIFLPIIRVCGSFLRMIILKIYYFKYFKKKVIFILDKILIKEILSESYYLWISLIAFIGYTQIDKIMIKKMLGFSEVGTYTIANQLASVLAIAIIPFQNSIYPKLMILHKENLEEYRKFYLKINTWFTQFYLISSILSIVVVKMSFSYVYSKEYLPAVECYMILVISILFKANGALQTGHMTLKKITKKSFYKTLFGLILNIGLNLVLIPKYGIYGAALATSITQIFTIFIIDFFIKEYREHFFIQLKSFNPMNIKKG